MTHKTVFLSVLLLGLSVSGSEFATVQEDFSGTPRFYGKISENCLYVDTRASNAPWNTIWVDEKGIFKAGNSYKVQFRYRIIDQENDGHLAFIVRPGNVEHHRNDLHAENGVAKQWTAVQFEVTVPDNASPYTLQIHAKGKVSAEISGLVIACQRTPYRMIKPGNTTSLKLPAGSQEFEIAQPQFPAEPVIVDAGEFGFSTEAPDNTQAWQRAVAACRTRQASKLLLPKGTFRFTSNTPLKLEDFRDFELDGNGALFVFHREKMPMHSSFLELSRNHRVILKKLNIDWDWEKMPLASTVQVLKVDPARKWIEVEFTEYGGFPAPESMRVADMEQLDPVTMSVGCENSKGALFEFIPGRYSPADMTWTAPDRMIIRKNTEQQDHFFTEIQPGELFRMRHYSYDAGAFILDDNQHITLKDINIYSCPGFGLLLAGRNQKFVELKRVKTVLPKGKKRNITSCADPVHSSQSAGFLKFIDCEFGFSGDDCINITDMHGLATVTAPDRLQLSTISIGTFRAGDVLELRELNFAPANRSVTVKKLLPGNSNDGSGALEIAEGLPQELIGHRFVIFNRGYGTRNVIIRNCKFHNNRARGILPQAQNMTIENNYFFHNQAGGMQIGTGYQEHYWGEGFGVSNVVVRNNVFDYVNVNSTRAGKFVRDIEILTYALPETDEPVYPLMQDILFENNTFVNPVGAVLYASGTENLIFRNNRIINTFNRKNEFAYRGAVVLEQVKNGFILDNEWNCHELNEGAGVIMNETTCKGITVSGDRFFTLPASVAPCKMELVSSWKIRVTDTTGKTAVLPVVPPVPEKIVDELHENLALFAPDNPGWARGTVLKHLAAAECSAAGALLPQSVTVKRPDGFVMTRGTDYELDPFWGTVGRSADGRIKENDAVLIDYSVRNSRLDAVIRQKDGSLIIRKGTPAPVLAQPPPLRYGEQMLGSVYLPAGADTLTDASLFPVMETESPTAVPVAEQLLPKTLKKLRNGERLRIVAWGDSVTAGTWLQPGERIGGGFAAALKERFPQADIELVTVGWPGKNSEMFFAEPPGSEWNYVARILDSRPDLILMEFVNDAGLSSDIWQKNYTRVVEDVRRIGAELILMTPHYVRPDWMGLTEEKRCDEDPRPYVQFLRKFAREHSIALADVSRSYGGLWRRGIPYTTLLVNGINHPNADGMKLFQKALLDLFPIK